MPLTNFYRYNFAIGRIAFYVHDLLIFFAQDKLQDAALFSVTIQNL